MSSQGFDELAILMKNRIYLNLGCGYRHMPGYINLDHDPLCNPDVVWEAGEPLPYSANSIYEINLTHSLEHMGETVESYKNLWQEFYRVLQPGGFVRIAVPHHLHPYFHNDPTHVRKVVPDALKLFSQKFNKECIEQGNAATTLGLQWGIDFDLIETRYALEDDFREAWKGLPMEHIHHLVARTNGACIEVQMVLKAVKDHE